MAIKRAIPPKGWFRRKPEATPLYEAVRSHAAAFEREVEERAGRPLPRHVRRELSAYLKCGILAYGFMRVFCLTCKDNFVVGFSCKCRGFCGSCGARRMTETAARWVDRLLPAVPYRQWVLSLPYDLRPRLAWDSELLGEVITIFQSCIKKRLSELAAERGFTVVAHGAVTVVQLFGSAMNLNPHGHSLVADGVWVEGADGLVFFVPLAVSEVDVMIVVARVCKKVTKLLKKKGILTKEGTLVPADLDEDGQIEMTLAQHSAALMIATGERATLRVRRKRLPQRIENIPVKSKKPYQANAEGFDLEAAVRISSDDRWMLERVAKYLLRPPLAMDRLKLREDGIYEYGLRRAWRDGTIAIELSPTELIEKLCALVPKPKVHLIRYHGVFAPNHPLRKRVVPKIPEEEQEVGLGGWKPRGGLVGVGYVSWAQLLKRSFGTDVLRCERCGNKRVLIEVVEPDAVREILGCLGLDFRGPRPESARGPPLCD